MDAIENAVQAAIADDEGRMIYMTLWERDQANIEIGRQQGKQEGRQEGITEGQFKYAYKLVENGNLDAAIAAANLEVPLDEFIKGMEAAGYKVPARA